MSRSESLPRSCGGGLRDRGRCRALGASGRSRELPNGICVTVPMEFGMWHHAMNSHAMPPECTSWDRGRCSQSGDPQL